MFADNGGPAVDAEDLRRRLYRPGASGEDVAAYARTLATQEPLPDKAPAAEPAPRRRALLPFALGALVVVALVGAVLMQTTNHRTASREPVVSELTTPTVASAHGGLPAVFDRGQRTDARGTAITNAAYPGRFLYTVVAGDTLRGMADRFGLCQPDVERSLPDDFDRSPLQPGTSLILGRIDDDTERMMIRSGTC